jgi:hypothetical protein
MGSIGEVARSEHCESQQDLRRNRERAYGVPEFGVCNKFRCKALVPHRQG